MINVKDLRIADVRFFDMKHNGLEYTQPLSKVILLHSDGIYMNLLSPGEIAPIYERVKNKFNPFGAEGYFGTKIKHVFGKEATGEAWLLTDDNLKRFFHSETVRIEQVEDMVLNDEDYFYNRSEIIQKRLSSKGLSPRDKVLLINKQISDDKKKAEMDAFFQERGVQKVYVK